VRFIATPQGLAPYDLAAREFLVNPGNGEPIEIEVLHPRDMVEHRRIFAQINELAKALHRPPESVRAELLFKTGNFQHLGELFGKTMISVSHMDRRHMKDHELHQFWDEALEIIRVELLPQITDAAERERLASTLLSSAEEPVPG
jgi:hypothetical protein